MHAMRPAVRRHLALAALLAITVVGVLAVNANAATYHAFLCRIPYGPNAGKPAPADGTTYQINGAFNVSEQNCATGGAMSASMGGGTTHPYGEGASVTFTPPAGETVAGFTVWRHEAVGPYVDFGAPATNIFYTGAQTVAGQGICARSLGCAFRGNAAAPFAAENAVSAAGLSGVTQVVWSATCGGGPGGTCPANAEGGPSALYETFAGDMLLNDPAPPAVTNVAGPLLAAGTLRGAQSVSFNAADAGSGVHKGTLLVDGNAVTDQVLDANGGACADLGVAPDQRPSFANTQPCPPAVSGALTLNTDALAPGAHALTVRVADAAGNQAVAATSTITVTGSVPAGTANGTGASRAAKLTARHTTTRKSARRLGFTTRPTITGSLRNEGGAPIASAAVVVLVRERRAGARAQAIATATTGADGSFRVALPSGPSRIITVQYTAFSGDAKPAAVKKLSLAVRARVSASFSPRSPRVGRRVRLSGRLRLLPRGGVDVRIQANQRGVWRTVDTVRTRRDGRFSWPYRFLPGQGGRTYAFRARVSSAIYPFAAGNSAVIRVRVKR
jgi:hypothetical protein